MEAFFLKKKIAPELNALWIVADVRAGDASPKTPTKDTVRQRVPREESLHLTSGFAPSEATQPLPDTFLFLAH